MLCVRLRCGMGEVSKRRSCPPCRESCTWSSPSGKGTVHPSCSSLACSSSHSSLGGGKELNPAFLSSLAPSMKEQYPSPLATFFEGKKASAGVFCWLLILTGMGAVL